jgi:LysM repeat protein
MIRKQLPTLLLFLIAMLLGAILMRMSLSPVPNSQNIAPVDAPQSQISSETPAPTETIPPFTPLATLTPSRTLLPPPTFEPPTATVEATNTPTITPTSTIDISVSIPGLRGAETPTPSTTPGCTVRQDWKLTYEVQRDDALEKIANHYNTYVSELVTGNCLTDANVIVIGQILRVPGDVQPAIQIYDCSWEVLTPVNGTLAIEGSGTITFNWRGPTAPRNLIRVVPPEGSGQGIYEIVLELRQNETLDLLKIPAAGTYTWYVYPLDANFVQVNCKEGGPWTFTKQLSPTLTPTTDPASLPGGG